MSSKRRQGTHFSLNSPVITVSQETTAASSNRSSHKVERSVQGSKKAPIYSSKLLPYVPPDALMFALFSAIQRRAWMRARKLCHELILCDPWRKNYRDLYDRIDQIIRVINQRIKAAQPPAPPSRTTTAATGDTERTMR